MKSFDWLVDNLNRNVVLDHIEHVEKSILPKDDAYVRFKKIEKNFVSLKKYQEWKYGKAKMILRRLLHKIFWRYF